MGTDIHSIIEYDNRHPTPEYRKWVRSRVQIFPNPYAELRYRVDNWHAPFNDEPFQSRDYDLFAMLNDVRNDGNITPLHTELTDRGVPEDASKSARKFLDGLHSITWFGLDELVAAHEAGHFTQATWEQGVVAASDYREFQLHGTTPTSWSRWVGGSGVKVGSADEVKPLLDAYTPPPPPDIPPMPGEPPRLRAPWNDGSKIGEFTHVHARWNRTIDRSTIVGEVLVIAKRFADPIGEPPKDRWIRDPETGVGIALKPDPRERDLTSVRFLIGYDS